MSMAHNPRPHVVIIAGPNGAGKTTLAPLLLRDTFGVVEYVNGDDIALGLSAFQPEKVAREAGRIMLKHLRTLAAQRRTFAFESTLATRSYAPWIRQLCQQDYAFHVLFLWLRSPDLAVQRVRERVRLGGHDVPEVVVRRRYQHGIRNFFDLYLPLATSWSVYDNSVAQAPLLLATGQGSALPIIYQPALWQRFCEARS
jgi:predicted ABC-type ATPase